MLGLKIRREEKLRKFRNLKPENLETQLETPYKISKPKRLQEWYYSIDFSPTISKISFSLLSSAIISIPFYKDGISQTAEVLTAGAFISYIALSCPNNKRNY